jgi:hypothetical protein
MFEAFPQLLLGLFTGILFGFLLQKGQVAKFNTIIGQLLLKDATVVKIMLTAVMVGSVGVYFLIGQDAASLSIKPATFAGVLVGAVLFGTGMALFGYCPGTSVAASGAGHKDAMVGVLGMFVGASVFVTLFPALKPLLNLLGDWGKVTLPQITHSEPWLWILGLLLVGTTALAMLEKRKLHKSPTAKERVPARSMK